MKARPGPLALALVVACVAFALYAPVRGFEFVEYDDPGYVRDNPHLADGLTAASARWAFASGGYQYNWHPFTWLSHALDVTCFAMDAGKHHLVNAFLHALNAGLLLLALAAITGALWPSAFAAALFALHPLRVESVAWIAERKDVLAGTCFALFLLAYARYARAPSRGRMLVVALALAAGLMAKPTLVTAPFVLLLLDVWPLGRAGAGPPKALVREKLPLFALVLASISATLWAQVEGGAVRMDVPLGARLANAALGYVAYIGDWVWPRDLACFYPHPALVHPGRTALVTASAALVLLVVLSVLAWRARGRAPWLLVGWCWFLGCLVPMIGLVQVGQLARADRYAYLPMIGLELTLAWSAAELVRARSRLRGPVVALALAVLCAFGVVAAQQLRTWRDSRTLFAHALAVTDDNFVAHNNLGLVQARAGEIAPAREHFAAAAEIWPGFFEAWLNLGLARYGSGDLAGARPAFEHAVALRPGHAEAHLDLAVTLARLDERDAARAELARTLALAPELADDPRARSLAAGLAQARSE